MPMAPAAKPGAPYRCDLKKPVRGVPEQKQRTDDTPIASLSGFNHRLEQIAIKNGIIIDHQHKIGIVLESGADADVSTLGKPQLAIASDHLDFGKLVANGLGCAVGRAVVNNNDMQIDAVC